MIVSKIKSNQISKEIRFNSSFFLNQDAINSRVLEENKDKCLPLSNKANVFNPPIFKRQFCQKTSNSIQYCQSSDVCNTLEGSEVYINKFQAIKVGSVVKKNQILVTGFGTIGNVRLANELTEGISYANNVCRIETNPDQFFGFIYAFMASKYGRSQLNKNSSGSVVKYIEAPGIKKTLIPNFSREKELEIHNLIIEATRLRTEANILLEDTKNLMLYDYLKLDIIDSNDYEYFGNHANKRTTSVFTRNVSEISAITINAFNYSKKIEKLENRVKKNNWLTLIECLDKKGLFSTGSFKRLELNSKSSVKLLNQSDIFNSIKQGKMLARKFLKLNSLLEYGEVLIAGVGTLGENETFCRVIFSNEELKEQLISGEFIRMKTNSDVPSGYLFLWLHSEYGFRLIRKTQSGTKLCRPIQKLLENLPVPIIEKELMIEIDSKVKSAHTGLFEAYNYEMKAIDLIEKEIESWQKS